MALASGGLVLTGLGAYLVYKMAKQYHVQAVEGLTASVGSSSSSSSTSEALGGMLGSRQSQDNVARGLRALLD